MRLAPFTALRASQHHVTAVSCPPADVLAASEATDLARAKVRSIVGVLRHADVVGAVEGIRPSPASHLVSLIEGGSLIRETEPWLYAYRVSGHGLKATGIIGRLDVPASGHRARGPDRRTSRSPSGAHRRNA